MATSKVRARGSPIVPRRDDERDAPRLIAYAGLGAQERQGRRRVLVSSRISMPARMTESGNHGENLKRSVSASGPQICGKRADDRLRWARTAAQAFSAFRCASRRSKCEARSRFRAGRQMWFRSRGAPVCTPALIHRSLLCSGFIDNGASNCLGNAEAALRSSTWCEQRGVAIDADRGGPASAG